MHLLAADLIEHVVSHDLFKIGPLWITNHMLMSLIAGLLMLAIFPWLFGKANPEAPTGLRNFFESILEFLRLEVFRPALKEHTDRFVPFLWTVFFFILFSNLIGLLPLNALFGLLTHGRVTEVNATATGNLMTTGALAIAAFILIHASGIYQVARDLMHGTYGHHGGHEEHSADGKRHHEAAMDLEHSRGDALAADVPQNFAATTDPTHHYSDDAHVSRHGRPAPEHADAGHGAHKGRSLPEAALLAVPLYLWNFAPHPFKPGPGESPLKWLMDIPMWGMLLILELMGAVIKPFSLSVRLFANMIAGHLVLAALLLLVVASPHLLTQIGIGIPVTIMSLMILCLELFVAFLQAYIFTFLTTLFIASAVAPEH
ncbi:MAG: atpB [Phycisphaerales bacterium]|jgi:F0F1-type ATP synthase membrane subunit a|nr:atpB [Phycisphaerales bacterium]MDB5298990.1 atpB [Phycisphaerales bacterium]